jgi:NADPH:quinone reductase-like Zn-dependent oxidoreductase
MKAIVQDAYGDPDVLRLEEVEEPIAAAGQVLVRVRASSVNMADVDYLLGRPLIARLGIGWSAPKNRIPGTDMAGVVEAVGEGVEGFGVGDEVFADLTEIGAGGWAELVCVSADALTKKPANLTFEEAAAIPSSGILAYQGLGRTRRITAGEQVLVNGAAGNVGPFAIQLAKSCGAEVTAVDRADKLDFLRGLGVDHVIDYTSSDYTRGPTRYDFIVDMAAYRSLFAVRRAMKPGGSYMMLGGPILRFFLAPLMGVLLYVFGKKRMGMPMWEANNSEDMEALRELAEAGTIKPVITRSYKLEEVPEAMAQVMSGDFEGKVSITIP